MKDIKIAFCCSKIYVIADVFDKLACTSMSNDCILSPFRLVHTLPDR